jgi:serine/threonine-protein kinase
MPLASGSRIGPYEISSRIGAGGMGEVFRAIDVNLGRPAAIKVLPAALAGDADRLARFEREAQTLALLNHPNIAQVFGFEKGEGAFRALAMELVEGPTLAERIAGRPIPIDEAIPIAIQIADALESAHDHGVIHRDLKPQNIKVRPDGTVKVLDFGLAKAIDTGAGSRESGTANANSPTITTPAITHAGVVLGTASYMSPEQARGRVVDRRADIWAFGCVLFEMLTGKRAFDGSEVSDVYVSVLRDEPAWPTLPAGTPPHVKSLLRRCLVKDVRRRLPHIGVARLELAEGPTEVVDAAPVLPAPAPRARASWLAGVATGLFLVALGAAGYLLWSRPVPTPATPVKLRIELGTADPTTLGAVALSPDGKLLAFIGRPQEDSLASMLYLRPLDRLDAQPVPGTAGATQPFFSPDGRWIGFQAAGVVKKVAIGGGEVISICSATAFRGGSWADDDTIVFGSADGLSRVSAAGGTPEPIFKIGQGQPPANLPNALPRGRGVLFQQAVNSDPTTGSIMVLPSGGGAAKQVVRGGRYPKYAASGHLIFTRSGTLLAVPFDLDALEARGEAVPVVEGLAQAAITALPNLAVSASGTLAYVPGASSQARQAAMMWLSQSALTPLRAAPAAFAGQRFSPDGRRVAMAISDGRQFDIWVYDWERDILTRVTNHPASDLAPVWMPDGTGLIFGSSRDSDTSGANLYWQRADGTGNAERLTTSDVAQLPDSIDPEGKLLVFHEGDPVRGRQQLGLFPIERSGIAVKAGKTTTLIGGPFLKANARISPDGKWMAYSANDTGAFEIYVQPFPALGERVQVSSGGGNIAVWSQKKHELYYAAAGQTRMMVVSYTVNGAAFLPSKPRQWSSTPFSATPPVSTYGPAIDLHPDGERFAVTAVTPAEDTTPSGPLVLLFNFFDELRRVAPVR